MRKIAGHLLMDKTQSWKPRTKDLQGRQQVVMLLMLELRQLCLRK